MKQITQRDRISAMKKVADGRLATEQESKVEAESLAVLTAQAALAGPIAEIWDTPEEDDAWAHLKDLHLKDIH